MTEAERAADPGDQLPADVTSFVGRRAERTEIRTLLGDSRLVTLTGFGGVGKTRLALKVAGVPSARRSAPCSATHAW